MLKFRAIEMTSLKQHSLLSIPKNYREQKNQDVFKQDFDGFNNKVIFELIIRWCYGHSR